MFIHEDLGTSGKGQQSNFSARLSFAYLHRFTVIGDTLSSSGCDQNPVACCFTGPHFPCNSNSGLFLDCYITEGKPSQCAPVLHFHNLLQIL